MADGQKECLVCASNALYREGCKRAMSGVDLAR